MFRIDRQILMILILVLALPSMAAGSTASAAGSGADVPGLVGVLCKMIFALAMVLGLFFLALHGARKLRVLQEKACGGNLIKILATKGIAPKKYVSVIEVGGEIIVLGMSEGSVSLLTRMDRAQILPSLGGPREDKDEGDKKNLFRFLRSR
ncbi:MAG: flagellar biosynthetic protein FliO [Thermodesulfobacteriota bacterium]|nr:flagellar biosynthetic protein FliO [Thermodesulfobacteriota bacterium]